MTLEKALSKKISGEVRFDSGSRALYATDSSNYRQVPIGVVIPKNKNDIIATIECCREFGAPILSRGGGTSLAGQCCNVAVVMDMSKYYNKLLELNVAEKFARIEPGIVLDVLRNAAEKHKLTFGPDPATHNHCTLGGMIGNNSCGMHAQKWGRTQNNILEMEILLYDGTLMTVGETSDEELTEIIQQGGRRGKIYSDLKSLRDKYALLIEKKFPKIPRKISGYNLEELLPGTPFNVARALVGTESTCVTVLEAKVKLVDNPCARSLVVLGYKDIYTAGDHVPQIVTHQPLGLEGLDDRIIHGMHKKHMHEDDIALLPKGNAWLMVEFGGDSRADSDKKAHALIEDLKSRDDAPTAKFFDDPEDEKKVWEVRESGLGATAQIPGRKDTWEGWEDAAVPPDKVGAYLREFRKLLDRYGYGCSLYGHFGQGCIHTRIDFDLLTAGGIATYRSFVNDAADLVVKYGGSLSGEHGDGQSRAELLPKMFGEELINAFRDFKHIWDPDHKMNPGKVVDAYRNIDNLRLGTNYNPPTLKTHFHFADDAGSFARATTRCVGVGECRREEKGTMCPSYRVTKEEQHSTRGRARLLFEMLQGNPLTKLWREKSVKEALDLCLACKGCKGDCPVNVDMATYKAEFLSHYYSKRLRPASAYAFGLIFKWSRLASRMPRVVNFFMQTWPFSVLMKFLAGMSQKRTIPRYATKSFKATHGDKILPIKKKDYLTDSKTPSVILWVDTFNNFFHPAIPQAAMTVLEKLNYRVLLPHENLCCGRPLYDYGMLTEAKKHLQQILQDFSEEIAAGIPLIGLEPSCFAVFKDELKNLFPHDYNAQRLREQSFMFSEFLQKHSHENAFPKLANSKAILHVHCHQSALIGKKSDIWLMKALGLDVEVLDSGCCGMAGSFGFEKQHYEVSRLVGEHSLLPKLRSADKSTLIVTNGFSCHEQISQLAEKESLHIAELTLKAFEEGIKEDLQSKGKVLKIDPNLHIMSEL